MKRSAIKTKVLIVLFSLISLNLFPQTFEEQTGIVLPGASKGSVTWGDYNNDGNLDILIAGFDASNTLIVKVFKNNGNNTFTDQGSIFSPVIPGTYSSYNCRALWADFNNDGNLDILINGPSNTGGNIIMIYRNEGNNTFTLQTSIPYLTWQENSVDCGDYDNDGDKDILLTTNVSTKIYQNKGNFVFIEQYSVSLPGFYKGSTKFGDYDNDGDLDIILTGTSGSYSTSSFIYQNQGNNVFVKQTGISLYGITSGSTEWGDYNNDGFLDLLLTGSYNTAPVIKNNGNNTFSPQSGIFMAPLTDAASKWGDLDSDGDLDIINTGNSSNAPFSRIYINNGNNTFTGATSVLLDGVKEGSVDLGDYDNDGRLDIIIMGNKGTSKICKVYRNVSLVANPTPDPPSGLTSVTSGNDIILKWNPVNTDNTPAKSISYNVMVGTVPDGSDVVNPNSLSTGSRKISGMGNAQLDTTFVLRNLNKGTYYWKVQAVDNSFKGSSFSAPVLPTFDYLASYQSYGLKVPVIGGKESTLTWSRGNGANCIVFMKEDSSGAALPLNNSSYNASPVFRSGNEIGTSGWYCVYKGAQNSVNVTGLSSNTNYIFQVLEFDGNAGSEVYNTNTSADNPFTFKTGIFSELKSANLLPVTGASLSYSQGSSCFWIDIDNDNDLDLLLVGQSYTRLYRNDGSGIFTLLPVSITSGYAAACGDYNNDGFIDIIINVNPPKLYKNNGDNTFTEQVSIVLPGTSYGAVAWGDYNNDGNLDLALTGETSTAGSIAKIFKNNGNNTFTEQSLITLTGVKGGTVKWADYDKDGFLDLLLSGFTNEATTVTKLYRNIKGNNFIEQTGIILPGVSYASIDWGDYDNDGYLDILIGTSGAIYHNNGDNTFTQLAVNLPTTMYGSAVWGDYDNDGDPDILVSGFASGYSPFTKVFKNNGNGAFTEDLASSIAGVGFSSTVWGDYDNDGDLDVLLTGNTVTEAVSKIYRNDIAVANVNPVAPTGISSIVSKSDVTLSWNSVRSDNTPYKAMSYNIRVGTITGGINIVSPHSAASGFRRTAGRGNCDLDTAYTLKNMAFGTYYWSVQAIDNGFAGGSFSAEGMFTVVPVQAKSLSAKISDNNSLLLKWERGNGDRCAVFCKQTSTGLAVPVNNTGYIPDNQYGFGGQIGSTGWYCVYNGRADSVNVTGLEYQKEYSFHVIEYMGAFGSEQYFTQIADGNPGVFSTSLFAEQTGITLANASRNSVVWGDYDNDGFIDLLVPGFPSKIYRNNGDNTFTEKTGILLVGVYNGAAAWGDYDNDGDLDILITGSTVNSYPGSSPVSKIYRNDGSDIFTEQTQISLTGVYSGSVAWGDYNNDGNLDILLTGATGTDPNFNPVSKIYKNNGDGTFTEQTQIILPGVLRGSAIWGDYNNDGYPDILLNGNLDYQTSLNLITEIFVNNRGNSFSWENQVGLSATGYSKSSWGDFDNDGDLDFLIATRGRMLVYQNMGNYQFLQQLNVYLPFQDACSAAWGDYDNDGYLDIILTNPGLDTKIYRNTRGITIPGAASQWFNRQDDEALKSYGYGFVNWVDYDNDGDLDFILAKDGLPTKLFKNNLIMKSGLFKPNTAPVAPTGLSATNSVLGVILKWNPVKNDETPFRSMAYNVQIGTRIDSANICSSNSSSTGFRKIPALGNGQLDTTFLLKNLPARKYYWSVQAVDQGLKGGVFSVVDSFDVKNILAFFSADTVCFGLNTTFTNQSAAFGGDVIQNYLWNFGDGTTSTLQNPTHLFSSSGVHNVSLIASSATNSDTLVKQVLVKIKPPVDFTANVACQGTETSIVNQTNTTGLNILSWTWDYGDGKGSTFQNPVSHGYLTAGDYQLTLIAAADNGCSGTIMKTVSVGAYPVATITASTPLTFCSGDSVALSVESNVKYSYNWILDGTSLTGGNTNRFLARSSGNYSVEVVNSTGACKTTSIPVSVTAQNAPTAPLISAGGTLQFCQGDSVTLSVTNTAGYTYQWKLNGGAVGANTNQFIAKNSGSYNVVVSNSTGCIASSTNTINVTVNSLPVAGAVSLSGSTTFCEGGSVILSISPSTGNSYNWRNANGLIAGANTNLYTAIRSGIYQLEITNASGCVVKTSSVSVLVKPMPKNPVIVPSDNYKAGKCLGEIPVKLNIDQVISGYNFQWYYNGVAINSANSSFIEGFLSPGNYYMEAGLNGCSAWSDTLNLHFEDAPAKPDIYATGPTVWYLACSNDSATQYKWYYNGNLIQGADKYLYVANQKLGKYNVSISNIKGCFTVSDTLKIPLGGTGIEDIYPFAGMKIYPNPTPGLFTIEMDNLIFGELMINILNQGGMQILKIKFEKTTEHFSSQIDLSGQAKGMYIINLKKDKYLATRKLVVN